MAIKFLVTGGTIDNLDYTSERKRPKYNKSLIPKMLKQGRITINYNVKVLMQKDSRFITDSDRKTILKNCLEAKEKQIIITHGTMTMPLTARFLGKKRIKKTIVLVGSLVLGNRKNFDGLFNLGTAVMAVQLLPNGVYITMNGKAFSWERVTKDLKTGNFRYK
jgi:L-asparaginase